jgi:MoaA/NifB/PqqE/SkfB family radical SAM enzyme
MAFVPQTQDADRLREIKIDFLDGLQHPACNACWNDENQGGKSFRMLQATTPATAEHILKLTRAEAAGEGTLEYLDLEFGYTCNMYCMSCTPYASTTWQQIMKINPWEDLEKGSIDADSLDKFISLVRKHRSTLRRINLYGGEPSVDPMYYKFIDQFLLSAVSTCTLGIVTNGNYSENYLKKFEDSLNKIIQSRTRILLTFSLDGVGEEGEFIRGGLNMERFTRNIKSAIRFGLRPRLQISVSMLNIENNIEIAKWLEQENLYHAVDVHFNKVSTPHNLSVNNLGNKIKEFLPNESDLAKYPKYYNGLMQFLGTDLDNLNPPNQQQLKWFIERLDHYSSITNQPLPSYYEDYRARIQNLIQTV